MIRFILGLVVVFGALGGADQGTLGLLQSTLTAVGGLLLMLWALPKIKQQYGDYR